MVHVRAGEGELIAALAALDLEAYGIEPTAELVGRARRLGRDVRRGSLADLAEMAAGSLGAVVLSGDIDIVAPGVLLDSLRAARTALRPGGTLIVASYDGESLAAEAPVLADLAPGRPLRPQTWRHVLGGLDVELLEAVEVERPGATAGLAPPGEEGPPPAVLMTVLVARTAPA